MLLLILLSPMCGPVMAAGGNGGSGGSDGSGGSGSGGSGSTGNAGDTAGNAAAGAVPTGTNGPQAQLLAEEQQRNQQETVEQPGVQINQQDRDQDQGRTNVNTTAGVASADLLRQQERDLFLQQVSLVEQNLSQDQDRDQARLDVALFALSISANVTGGAGPQISGLASQINASYGPLTKAEQQIQSRSSFTRMILGGDQEAAGLVIQYADQNQQVIMQMEQLLANCSECDPEVSQTLQEQLQVLTAEQNRLIAVGQQEEADKGLFGWLSGVTGILTGTGQATALTDDEKYWMTYMREEEKLARDVYTSLGAQWNLPVFTNIARSEQTHMDSVKTLLDRYGVQDPAAGTAPGEFRNPVLQQLYNDLISQGTISVVDALKVGVLIEETDIVDLDKAIAATQHNDIRTVYENLRQGSLNHLNSFESILAGY